MTRRAFDLVATERRATDRTIALALYVVRAYILSRHAVRDLPRRVGWRR